jgi:hypothetical protein
MKKLVLLLMTGMLLIAEESWFVGIETGSINISADTTLAGTTDHNLTSVAESTPESYTGLKVGKHFDNSRVYITAAKGNGSSSLYSLSYDYTVESDFPLKPVVGVNYTHYRMNVDAMDNNNTVKVVGDVQSNHLMGTIGLVYKSERFDVESGYRSDILNSTKSNVTADGEKLGVELKNKGQLYISANYKFSLLSENQNRQNIGDYKEGGYQERVYVEEPSSTVYRDDDGQYHGKIIVNSIDKPRSGDYGVVFY